MSINSNENTEIIIGEPQENMCSICWETFSEENDDTHTLPECNHKFHSNCLITHLRTGNNSCPLCRSISEISYDYSQYSAARTKLDLVIRYSKMKKASNTVVYYVKRYKYFKQLHEKSKKEYTKINREFKAKHREELKKIRIARSNIWKMYRKVNMAKDDILNLPIIPMVIRV
jgi:hypothetical protein